MRKVLPILTLSFFAFAVPAFQQGYQVNVTTVSVWVKVMNSSGSPVSGLTSADFEIYEDGERANITCFEEQQSAEPAAGGSQASTPPQKFVLFLDLFNTTPIEYNRIKPQIQDFVQSLYGKNNEIMLAAVLPTRKLGVICPFTRDLNRVRILLGKAIANPMRDVDMDRKYDELFRVFEGTEGDTLADIASSVAHEAESLANQEQAESEFSLGALESFAGYLTANDAHEQIIMLLISGGFSRDPGRRFYEIVDRLALRALNNDPLKFTGFKRSNFDFENELKKTVGKLSRSNVAIYTLDTRGAVRRKEYQDSLIEIADETGGISFYNSLNFKEGLTRVMKDLEHQYVLCYSAQTHQKAGSYHKIKVVCKKSDTELRYRNGYFD